MNKPPRYPKTTGSEPCATTDPEIWFPERSNQYLKVMAIAKNLCRTCPIMYDCAQYAIHSDVEGIWGATNEKERKAIQQAQGIQVFKFVKIMSQTLDQMAASRGS